MENMKNVASLAVKELVTEKIPLFKIKGTGYNLAKWLRIVEKR